MGWITSPENWRALVTLTVLEIVLGIEPQGADRRLGRWARLPTSNGNCEQGIQRGQIPLQRRYCRGPYPCHRILAGLTRSAGHLLRSIVLCRDGTEIVFLGIQQSMPYASGETPETGDQISDKRGRVGAVTRITINLRKVSELTIRWNDGIVGILYPVAEDFTLISRAVKSDVK